MKVTDENKSIPQLRSPDLAQDRFYGKRIPISFRKDSYENGGSQLEHIHDFVQIWYCISGKCLHTVEDRVFDMAAGDIVIVPTGKVHKFKTAANTELFSLSISTEVFLEADFPSAKELFFYSLLPVFSDGISEKFSTRKISLSSESSEKFKSHFSFLASSFLGLRELLPEINKLFSLPEFFLTEEERESAEKALQKKAMPIIRAVKYINGHISERISIDDLLRVSYLCQTSFFSLFKTFMGMRCSYYIQRVRVTRAVFYLAHTSYDISAVSDFCGFNSPSHLVLCHKKQTGLLPKYFRTKLKEFYDKNPELKRSIKF